MNFTEATKIPTVPLRGRGRNLQSRYCCFDNAESRYYRVVRWVRVPVPVDSNVDASSRATLVILLFDQNVLIIAYRRA